MASNEWIGGYLDAIVDSGPAFTDHSTKLEDYDTSAVTRYFVQEIKGSNEAELHRAWQKATAQKNTSERVARMENFCWRIWHITRQRKQIEWEEATRLAQRRVDEEETRWETPEEAAEDPETPLEESDQIDALPSGDGSTAGQGGETGMPEEAPEKKLYIIMMSLHGLVRGENMELGRDSDTGGQVKYVVEFARALASMPQVYRVDLLTRQIMDPEVDSSYAEPSEELSLDDYSGSGESSGAYIIRIPCGPRDKYIRKELLWPHIAEFVDGALAHILNMTRVLGEVLGTEQPVWPHAIHGHYADAGDIASILSGALNVPMVLTGHSLGRNKLEQLLKQGKRPADIDSTYKIMRRCEAEEFSVDSAELVVTSTRQEIEQQWGLYDGFDVTVERKLRLRLKRGHSCHGRYMPRMVVIPPGMDFSSVTQETHNVEDDRLTEGDTRPVPPIWEKIIRFFTHPTKPMILALARPDPKKNLATLVKAYGECKPLRELANLVLIMGNRNDIDTMDQGNAEVLTLVLKLIDKYDMYGQVAYPKHHGQSDVPEIYRLAAKSKGVFVNPALVEPFGLTLIEAAAHGLPMVATKNGGPVDIQRTLSNGVLVDPHDQEGLSEALLKLISDRGTWAECRKNGLENIHAYSWPEHCRKYLQTVAKCRLRHPQWRGDDFSADESSGLYESDSLRDAGDLSMWLSIDGKTLSGSFSGVASGADLERKMAEREQTQHQPGLSRRALGARSTGLQPTIEDEDEDEAAAPKPASAGSFLRKKAGLILVALDSYESDGQPGKYLIEAIQWAVSAAKSNALGERMAVGVATSLTAVEIVKLLNSAGVALADVDILITGSGSEVFYTVGGQVTPDSDYDAHIEYRWFGEGLRKSMFRVIDAAREGGGEGGAGSKAGIVTEETAYSSNKRLTYKITNPSLAPITTALKKRLRMRGYRCHVVYCRAATWLHLLPLHASRAQALRYLFVRWGLSLTRTAVILGPDGDGDHKELLVGAHRTVIVGAPGCEPSSQAHAALQATTEGEELLRNANVLALDKEGGIGALSKLTSSLWDGIQK